MITITESTPVERAALLTCWLVTGRSLTASQAAQMLKVSPRTARRLLATISRSVPVEKDEFTGRWHYAPPDGRVEISPY
jgi:predicted DNA-binding transcriptional regulator YafY